MNTYCAILPQCGFQKRVSSDQLPQVSDTILHSRAKVDMLRVSSVVRSFGLSTRAKSSLIDTHEMFLNLVKDHGDGNVNMINHDNYVEIVLNNPTKRNAVSGKNDV